MWFGILKQVCLLIGIVCSCRGKKGVIDPTMLHFDPSNLSVLEGNNATLTCNISNAENSVYYIKWNNQTSYVYKGCRVTGPLTNTLEYSVRCINEDVQITILKVSRVRHGEVWICQRIMLEKLYESGSTITVKVPITNVRIEPQMVYTITKENTPTKFVCVTSAGYPMATIRWYKNNTELSSGNVTASSTTSGNYLKVVTSTLTLHLTRADNISQINCAANNNGTTWEYSNRTSVIVYYAPDVPIITNGSTQVQVYLKVIEGNAVNVICTASSYPDPYYSWTTPNGSIITGHRLLITNISRNEDGRYTCKASNTMVLSFGVTYQGANALSVIVSVLYPPSQPIFKYQKANSNKQHEITNTLLHTVRIDRFNLTCTTDSQPQSTCRWTGQSHFQETNTTTLTMVSIQNDMNLTCTATNIMIETFGMTSTRSANSTIIIIVLYPPRNTEFRATNSDGILIENIYNVNVTEGDTITVTCQADSRPAPYGYYWSVDASENSTTMQLTDVKRTMAGAYSCEARNRMNRTFGNPEEGNQSNSISINILHPPTSPTFIYNNISGSIITGGIIKVIKGNSVKVVCNTTGNPVPVYNWYNTAVTSGQILEVKTVASDTTWTCRVTNFMIDSFGNHESGKAERALSLEILYPPEAIQLKVNGMETTTINNTALVVEGSNVTLSCDANSKPFPSTYTWYKLEPTTLQTAGTGEYKIVRINRTQAGRYECLAEYVMNPSFEQKESGNVSTNLCLEVLYPTQIDTFEANGQKNVAVIVNETDNITFVCKVDGKPASHVSILYGGQSLKQAIVKSIVNHTVTNVTCVQHGLYACAANNSYSRESAMRNLTLFVLCSPRPKPDSELQTVFASALGGNTMISFNVLAYPVPTENGFMWKKEIEIDSSWAELRNSETMQISSSELQSNLTLNNVSKSSFGNYSFHVTNSVGTYTHQFVLKAEDKPQSPTDFHHVEELATDSTLTFIWSPGFDGGPPQTFVLHYRKSNSKDEWLVQIIPDNGSPIMNTTLESLTSSAMYDVYLIASNKRGNSTAVMITAVQTRAAVELVVGNSIIPAVSWVTASIVVICAIVVLVVLYKRRHNQKDPERHHCATTANVSRGVYEIGPCETVFSHRNDDAEANKDGTESKSKIYQNVPDLQLASSAPGSKQSSAKAQQAAAPVPSNMIYQNLPGFSTKRKASNKPNIKPKVVEKSSPLSLLEPDDDEFHCDRQNNDVYGNVGRRLERVQVQELLTYVTSKSYEPEYAGFLKGIQFPTTFAMKPENIKLNRYQGIYPYDHSRVTIPGDPNFFMNACYINGYNREKAYIASLGPTSDTTNGYRIFWKMVWYGQTDIIVMVTNLREITGMKCQQYWPELGTSITYGDVTVTSQAVTIYAEYTVRVFSVSKSGVFRTLHQLHFTAWPDKGVPDDVTSLLEFRNRIKSTSTMGTGPIIVHCSAGIGRTGTLIALDILIDEGKADGSVNVSDCVKRLREQRVNMVQTAEQYAFVYKALVYILAFECETIHSETFQEYLESSTDMFFENMLKQLQPNVARDAEAEARRRNENYTKINRPGADIPGDKHSVKLYLNKDSDDVDYINAVYINSFKKKNHFISAQTPRITLEEDFLNLIFQEGCLCIVTFDQSEAHGNERDIGVYLPPENQNLTIGNFNLSCSRLETKPQYIVRRMKVENHGKFDSGEKISYHFQYTRWESDKRMPDDPSEFAQFIKEIDQYVNELGETDVHVLVHCMDASERSGLFCSIATMIEKIECEGRVNVGNTIRQIRNRRMTAIQNMEQLRFCHQAVNAYINMKTPH